MEVRFSEKEIFEMHKKASEIVKEIRAKKEELLKVLTIEQYEHLADYETWFEFIYANEFMKKINGSKNNP